MLRSRSSHIPLRSSCVQLSVYDALSILKHFLCAVCWRKQTDCSIANARCYPKLGARAEFRDIAVCTMLIAIETPVTLIWGYRWACNSLIQQPIETKFDIRMLFNERTCTSRMLSILGEREQSHREQIVGSYMCTYVCWCELEH